MKWVNDTTLATPNRRNLRITSAGRSTPHWTKGRHWELAGAKRSKWGRPPWPLFRGYLLAFDPQRVGCPFGFDSPPRKVAPQPRHMPRLLGEEAHDLRGPAGAAGRRTGSGHCTTSTLVTWKLGGSKTTFWWPCQWKGRVAQGVIWCSPSPALA